LSLAFEDVAAEKYAYIRADLARRGQLIGPNDLMIAAICIANDVTLVTHNTAEFGRIDGLKLEDWEI
jgi:tRNA(fMet)-specific endonuclease VapC